MNKVHKDVKILGLAFLFIFIGYSGVQHFLTQHFESIGAKDVGFISLILIYLFIALSAPVADRIILKLGSRETMILGAITYATYIASLLTVSPILIYVSSALLGFGASLLWNGHGSYIIRASDQTDYGRNVGFSISMKEIGGAMGIFLFGAIVKYYSSLSPFLFFALFPVVGIFILSLLKPNHPDGHKIKDHGSFMKACASPTALKLSLFGFATMFVYGVVIGIIPIEIKNILGIEYVAIWGIAGTLGAVFFSYHIGLLSDRIGRRKMIFISCGSGALGLAGIYFSSGQISFIMGAVALLIHAVFTGGINTSLVGDSSSEKNVEALTGIFLAVRTVGTVSALLLSIVTPGRMVYLIAIAVIIAGIAVLIPVLRLKPAELKSKISGEIASA